MHRLDPIMLPDQNLPTGWEPKETLPEGWKSKSNLGVVSDCDWRLTLIDIDGQGLRPSTLGQAHLSKQLLQLDFLLGDPTSQVFTNALHFSSES